MNTENKPCNLTDEGGPPGVATFLPQPDLIHRPVLSEYIIKLLGRDAEGKIADVQYAIDLRGQPRLRHGGRGAAGMAWQR